MPCGAWSRSSICRASCFITSEPRAPMPESFSSPSGLLYRVMTIQRLRRRLVQPGISRSSITSRMKKPVQEGSEVRAQSLLAALIGSADRGSFLSAQVDRRRHWVSITWGPGSKSPHHRCPSRRLCLLPCTALRTQRRPLEPEAHHANLHDLREQHRKEQRGTSQCSVPTAINASVAMTAPSRLGPPWHMARSPPADTMNTDRRIRQQHAVIAPVEPGVALSR